MKQKQKTTSVAFKALALAMGVIVVVLSAFKMISSEISLLLLGIGLFCISVVSLLEDVWE